MITTTLRTHYVFGIIKSRRLGNSLGINILPIEKKICSFNCIYCECGWNSKEVNENISQDLLTFPAKEIIHSELEIALTEIIKHSKPIDVITFSGNGEPTLHPQFSEIINETIYLRNKYLPKTQIAVLSNSTNLHKEEIINSLKQIDKPILKLDSTNINTFEKINLFKINNNKKNESSVISIKKIIEGMKSFEGNFIFQIMFLRGSIGDEVVDNTTNLEIAGLINAIKETSPKQVMIYSIDRIPPAKNLIKLSNDEMKKIAMLIKNNGINVLYV